MLKKYTVDDIEKIILDCLGVTKEKLIVKSNKREMVGARSVMFYFLKHKTNLSSLMIGDRFNKDHATVLYSLNNLETYKKYDKTLREKMDMLEERFIGVPKVIICTHCRREL